MRIVPDKTSRSVPTTPLSHTPVAEGARLRHSKSVTAHLDARFKGAVLFERPGAHDLDGPLDDVLQNIAKKKRKPRGGVPLFQYWVRALMRDPWLRAAVVLAGSSGAVVGGVAGGACGLAAGGSVGAVVGAPAALFTFGLSIPAGAAAGGALGTGIGAMAGGALGLVSGSAVGAALYGRRGQLAAGAAVARDVVLHSASSTTSRACGALTAGQEQLTVAVARARAASSEVASVATASASAKASQIINDQKVQVAAVSAAASSVALGTGGGAMGLLIGSATGAAWGVIPAFLTFGLSIPVGATVLGAAGMVTGATAGGAVGLVGGGAVGYGAAALAGEDRVHYVRGKASAALRRRSYSSGTSRSRSSSEGSRAGRREPPPEETEADDFVSAAGGDLESLEAPNSIASFATAGLGGTTASAAAGSDVALPEDALGADRGVLEADVDLGGADWRGGTGGTS